MSTFKFSLPTNESEINLELSSSKALFVLGGNGVGKSSLMHKLYSQNSKMSKRILAHRQTWFDDNASNMTALNRKNNVQHMIDMDSNLESRWRDYFPQQRTSLSLFDLVNAQNLRAREIAEAVDKLDMKSARDASSRKSPIDAINELLAIANIPIILTLNRYDQLFASKNNSAPYSIAELSDGERNALLICSDVLTAPANNVIILDEPERHLHRSIISPLLTSLFQKRPDCAFVISTHDVSLPIDYPEADVLLVRNCVWENNKVKSWDVDLLKEDEDIPEDVKREVLGSKRNILFVEGTSGSLDKQLYQIIYPTVSVIAQGNCSQVEKSVTGIKETKELHWVNAFGLVDADDRTAEQIKDLYDKGIAALNAYSVESLYYNLDIIKMVAKRYAEISGADANELFSAATNNIVNDLSEHKERLCAILCEKKARVELMNKLPNHSDFVTREPYKIEFDSAQMLEKEELLFDRLIEENNIAALLNRYPIRSTPALNNIVKGLRLSRENYEASVRKLIIDNESARTYLKGLLSNLTILINGKEVEEVVAA